MNYVSLALSVVAIVLSCLSLLYTHRQTNAGEALAGIEQDRRNDEVRQAVREEEAQRRAGVSVQLLPRVPRGSRKIEVRNAGPSPATDLLVTYLDALDGGPPPETARWHDLGGTLGPGEWRRAVAGVYMQSSKRFRVLAEWRDGSCKQQREFVLHT